MLEQFFPDALSNSIYDIDFKKLYHMGYRGVLFDIDNTLTEHGAPATASVIHFFENLRTIGFTTCLVSNNKAPRILPFAKEVNSYYQIFTDIWGARRLGIYSILVQPINKKEEIQIVLKRIPEKWILHQYRKRG